MSKRPFRRALEELSKIKPNTERDFWRVQKWNRNGSYKLIATRIEDGMHYAGSKGTYLIYSEARGWHEDFTTLQDKGGICTINGLEYTEDKKFADWYRQEYNIKDVVPTGM